MSDVFPDADRDRPTQVAREIDLQIVTVQLNSPERPAHFVGQVIQEVGQQMRLVESLDCRDDRLGSIFSYFMRNPDEALLYGRTADHPADQEAIANRAYADRNGKGDIESGDGWRFRGRGLKQVTGRANCRAFAEAHTRMFGEQSDFEADPDLLGTPPTPFVRPFGSGTPTISFRSRTQVSIALPPTALPQSSIVGRIPMGNIGKTFVAVNPGDEMDIGNGGVI